MRAKEEAASGDTGSVHIPLKGAAKPVSRPSTNTVKLARFKAGAEENNEKLAAVQNQQQSGIHVDQNAIQQELAQNNGSSGHRRTISSGVKAAPAPAKKWWEFWKK